MRMSIRIMSLCLPVLAGLATITVDSTPTFARKLTCVQKAQACERRCAARYKDFIPCINRTCDKQYGTCGGGTTFKLTPAVPAERRPK